MLVWSVNCAISNLKGSGAFKTTKTTLYVPVVSYSTEDNIKLLGR